MIKRFFFFLAGLLAVQAVFAQNAVEKNDTLPKISELNEIMVIASYTSQQAKEPLVSSTITAAAIEDRLSNLEFPQILNSTPSAFATRQGGGYGDSRIILRGFGSENIGLLIDGIPVNGMENGAVYWSNWAGLADVANTVQVQRGVGLSKLGIPSVGGTINIITRRAQAEQGGFAYYGLGNDGYQKLGALFSTGTTPKGWTVTLMGSRTWGDGYVNGTNFDAWSYYGSVSKTIGKKHLISLTAFGAPQWHNRRANRQSIEDYENNRDGIRMNTSYGYINGKVVPTQSGYNEYHKPQITLNHYWNINSRSSLSTSVYASMASGGGRLAYGKDANRIQYNSRTGKPNPQTDLTPEGLIDYGPAMEANRASTTGSTAIFTMETNAHDWYGLLSTYTNRFRNGIRLTAGIDGRYYVGYHYEEISDLLGGAYYKDNRLAYRDPDTKLKVGDKVNKDYTSYILWVGAFAQAEYVRDSYKAFLSASVTSHSYKREDPGKYGVFSDQEKYPAGDVKTAWRTFVPVSIKAGVNYKIARIHHLFVNGGYVTRAPKMDNIYLDNKPVSDPITEKIYTVEAGYKLNMNKLNVTLNGYYTKWMDKSVTKFFGNDKYCIPNIDARHMGIELEADYRPVPSLRLGGFLSVGNWRWTNDVEYIYYTNNGTEQKKYNAYLKDLHVGGAPQTSVALAVSWEPFKRFFIGANYNYYGRYYADFYPDNRTSSNDRADAWKLPDSQIVDLNVNYTLPLGKKTALKFFGNVNNLFNNEYIADALDGSAHDRETALVWYGFGRTWTAGMRILF